MGEGEARPIVGEELGHRGGPLHDDLDVHRLARDPHVYADLGPREAQPDHVTGLHIHSIPVARRTCHVPLLAPWLAQTMGWQRSEPCLG